MTTDTERWELAASIQLTPATETLDPQHFGVVTARPHPTGWFISARYRSGLSTAQVDDFAEFVRVRTYLLLTSGPDATTWQADDGGTFYAWCERAETIPQEWLAA